MKKLKVGVVGLRRGAMMRKYCLHAENAVLVAICDKREAGLEKVKSELNDSSIAYYTDYETFLTHDMDVVMLANYATEHAPFAIRAMEAGKDVISEVLPVQTMAEAVALIECVQRTGRVYRYAENYCFMLAPQEMRRRYRAGELGAFEYGEGEYMHNCEPIWTSVTYGDPSHWRNNMSALFYCTHSVGPLLHLSGLRPVSVNGFETPFNARMARMGAKAGGIGMEVVTLENGAVLKSIHGVGCSKNSVWFSVYGAKGRMESAREDAEAGDVSLIYANLDKVEGVSEANVQHYQPDFPMADKAEGYGHGGSDFYCLYNALDYIGGNREADTVDEYEAIDMWMCGFFGYLSVLNGNCAMQIPDLHDPAVRDRLRNDHRCTDPLIGREQTLPSYSKGNPEIPPALYEARRAEWERTQQEIDFGVKKGE